LRIQRKWALEHLNWTVENWNAVAFSDESISMSLGWMEYNGVGGDQGRGWIQDL